MADEEDEVLDMMPACEDVEAVLESSAGLQNDSLPPLKDSLTVICILVCLCMYACSMHTDCVDSWMLNVFGSNTSSCMSARSRRADFLVTMCTHSHACTDTYIIT